MQYRVYVEDNKIAEAGKGRKRIGAGLRLDPWVVEGIRRAHYIFCSCEIQKRSFTFPCPGLMRGCDRFT